MKICFLSLFFKIFMLIKTVVFRFWIRVGSSRMAKRKRCATVYFFIITVTVRDGFWDS